MKLFHTLFFTLFLLFSSSAMSAQAQAQAEKLNINTASAEQIATTMTGIGNSKAKAIVEYRSTKGKFTSINDLENVGGIGSKTIEKNKDKISL
ncbi:MAG: helix-hairpin-helix domain-containing protein [Gammaproteobacteria bacterium]|nr:helix-hairpin-helix domain-containing protein [Gammaproteobacteria bacterium]